MVSRWGHWSLPIMRQMRWVLVSMGGTYGGNPLAMAVGHAVLDVLLQDGFLSQVSEKGAYFLDGLHRLVEQFPSILSVARGRGLMLALQTAMDNRLFVAHARQHGLLLAAAADNAVRIVPPLIVSSADIDTALAMLTSACKELSHHAA